MLTVLQPTDTTAEFTTGWSGPHLHSVTGLTGANSIKLQFQTPAGTWADVDTAGENAVTWNSDGHGASYLSAGLRYRYLAALAGPTVQIIIIDRESSAGAPTQTGPLGITVF